MRSLQPETCGDVYAPVRRPAPSSSAAVIRVVVDFPLVPTTWIAGKRSCGSPSSRSSARMRSSPNSSGHGESAATQAVALAAEGFELGAVLLQLRLLGPNDIARRPLTEALVGKLALGPFDLCAQTLDL